LERKRRRRRRRRKKKKKRRGIWVGTGRKGIGFHELLKKKSCSSLLFTQHESSLKP
jgi:hypothetical protein